MLKGKKIKQLRKIMNETASLLLASNSHANLQTVNTSSLPLAVKFNAQGISSSSAREMTEAFYNALTTKATHSECFVLPHDI